MADPGLNPLRKPGILRLRQKRRQSASSRALRYAKHLGQRGPNLA